jgi:hypothetical protein
MANSKSLANIGYVSIFGFALGILLGSYFVLWIGLRFGKSSLVGSVTWNCLEFLSLYMQDLGWWDVCLFGFLWPLGLPEIPSLVVLVPGSLIWGILFLGAGSKGCWKPLPWWTSRTVYLSTEEACEDNLYYPWLDQGDKEFFRVTLGTYFRYKKVTANRAKLIYEQAATKWTMDSHMLLPTCLHS